jgi:hypothetical protein
MKHVFLYDLFNDVYGNGVNLLSEKINTVKKTQPFY